MNDELEEFSVQFVIDTGKAWLLLFDDDEEKRWIPISMIDEEQSDAFEKDEDGVVYIKKWFAEKEGFSNT